MNAVALLALLAIAGCSAPPSSPATDGGAWPAAYAIATTLQANTPQATSLIVAVPSLAAGTPVDESQAIPIADTASLFGVEGSGHFYATTAMAANVTRYDVDQHGVVTPGPILSFAQFGLGNSYSTRSLVFAAPDKAYLLDDTTLQAITFDPQAMAVGHAIDLTALQKTDYRTNFAYNIPQRANQLVVAAFYYDATYSHTLSETALALIDTTTDAVTIVRDTRCGVFSTVAAAPNGDLYFGSDTYSVAIHRVASDSAPAGCLLRLNAADNAFDQNFFVAVADLTGGQPGGGAVPGDGNSLWVRAFDESLFSVTDATSALYILAAPAWSWWQVNLAHPSAPATKSPFPPGAGEVRYFSVEDRAWAGNSGADYTTSTLLDMTSTGAPLAGLQLMGQPSGLVKVR